MIITKQITNGSSNLIKDPTRWSGDDLLLIARRILRSTGKHEVVSVGFDVALLDSMPLCLRFTVEVGDKIKLSRKDRLLMLRDLLETEQVIASL